jgi:putative peptidoglycan lipid II flippase
VSAAREGEPAGGASSRLARDSLIVGAATVASRILGFVRDVLIARALGAGPAAEAFLIAFRLPNMLRRALGEGGLNAAIVPIYLDEKASRGPDAARGFGQQAAAALALLLLALVGLAEIAAPIVVLALAGGLGGEPNTWALATQAARLAFPFLLFTGLASLLAAILAAERRFTLAAWAPLALNGALIAALVLGEGLPREQLALWLAASVTLGGFIHLVLVWWAARRAGLGVLAGLGAFGGLGRPSPAVKRAIRLGLPAFIASAAAQGIMLAALQVASREPGAVAWLHYADRVFQLPLGFVAVAMGIVLLPAIAQREAAGDAAGRQAALDGALAFGWLMALPAGVALAMLADPIVAALFERGAFGPRDRAETALALAILGAALPFAVTARVLTQAWLARQAPAPPIIVASLALAAAIPAGLLVPLSAAGQAAGIAAMAFIGQALGLALAAAAQGLWRPTRALLGHGARTLLATAGMAAVLWLAQPFFQPTIATAADGARFVAVMALCALGMAALAGLALPLGLLRPLDAALPSPRLASPRPPRA